MDLLAGLTLAGLLLPEAVAYSTIAGLPPQAGVLALFAGLVCYGVIGTSRFAIVSATSSSAAVLAVASASLGGSRALGQSPPSRHDGHYLFKPDPNCVNNAGARWNN